MFARFESFRHKLFWVNSAPHRVEIVFRNKSQTVEVEEMNFFLEKRLPLENFFFIRHKETASLETQLQPDSRT